MKAVMYHYVRPDKGGLPHLRYLPLDGFRRQLDHFAETYGFVAEEDFEDALKGGGDVPDGVVLTFDDGLSDHHGFVLPELRARGLWGIFYVPSLPYDSRRVLDVHKTHIALGRFGGETVLDVVEGLLTDDMLDERVVAELDDRLYRGHREDAATSRVKRLLNYFVRVDRRGELCARVFAELGCDEAHEAGRHYATPEQLRELRAAGMTVGAHSVSHRLLSQLTRDEQEQEVAGSIATVADIVGEPVTTFCFPYGGDHSFDGWTLELLRREGVRYGFSVEPRDVVAADLLERPLALPRHDCNTFPHGRAAGISASPAER
jgi:peptidoglycan/xylan/chitin deacetylase (PgdA/CDA1 family)